MTEDSAPSDLEGDSRGDVQAVLDARFYFEEHAAKVNGGQLRLLALGRATPRPPIKERAATHPPSFVTSIPVVTREVLVDTTPPYAGKRPAPLFRQDQWLNKYDCPTRQQLGRRKPGIRLLSMKVPEIAKLISERAGGRVELQITTGKGRVTTRQYLYHIWSDGWIDFCVRGDAPDPNRMALLLR